ncbi:MAG: hypothetical protein IJI80_07810 [Methanobrevibacter sp.]|uniref:hypothetical protein n=1 Tax=Methanobrevibacter sp. TaxID=66852 RepID=UPI0025E97BD4|nr:hypothetical protein [Methanobrevibacter sp.]MBQ6139561.1 hypothetical protein [Methanobrevibacter sp.]
MKSGKFLFIAMIFLVSLLCLSAVSAADDAASDVIADTIDEPILEESIDDADLGDIESDENILTDGDTPPLPPIPRPFSMLNKTIGDSGDEVNLSIDYYQFDETDFKEGIYIDRDLTINGNGHSINGNNQARIFFVESGCIVTFKNINFVDANASDCVNTGNYGGAICSFGNVTVINCTFTDNSAEYDGGAIATGIDGECNVINCTFTGNSADRGGALYYYESEGTVINCTFTGNFAGEWGGAICVDDYAECTAKNCNFTDNSAGEYSGAIDCGNAIYCNFINNTSEKAGALYGGNVTNCIFTGNSATEGGAILEGNAEKCTFINNNADNGGAMVNSSAINCNFIDNSATNEGGAIYKSNATDCNFIVNRASSSGGAFRGVDDASNFAKNCNFIGNTASDGGAIFYGTAIKCNFTENKATTGVGGAIEYGSASNCNFISNNAKTLGGAMYYSDATNCAFIGNTAGNEGGAMFNGAAENCTFALNSASVEGTNDSSETMKDDNCKSFTPVLSASDFSTVYNYGEKFTFKFADGNQLFNGLNAVISIYKNGTFVGNYSVLTGEGWVVNLPVGTYNAILSITNINVAPASATITVAKNPAKLIASSVTAIYNNNKYLVITLKDGKNRVLSGIKVTVNLGTAKTYTTDKNGQIKINVAKLVPKTYTVKIAYAGNAYYVAASKSVKVVVKKATPKMTAKAKTFKVNVKTKKYTVTLKNNVKKVMKKTKLTLKVGKKTYKATTNSKGKATFKITKLTKKGKYNAVIKFAGNKYYNKLSKKAKITIR